MSPVGGRTLFPFSLGVSAMMPVHPARMAGPAIHTKARRRERGDVAGQHSTVFAASGRDVKRDVGSLIYF
jgi:hypothetical protein